MTFTNSDIQHLRKLSASALDKRLPEAVFDFVLSAVMRKRLGTFEDEWDPEALLVACGFQVLVNAETVVAAGDPLEGEPGDLFLRVAFSEARAGAPGRDERDMIIEICGNWHSGDGN